MLIFIRVIVAVYFLAANVYAFILVNNQKTAFEEGDKCSVRDGKIFAAGVLGGAAGVYIAMFIYHYRLSNMFLMLTMPVLIAINVFLIIFFFSQGFGLDGDMPYQYAKALVNASKYIIN